MTLSTATLWLLLAGLAALTAYRDKIVGWLCDRVTFWRIMALLFERPARHGPAAPGPRRPPGGAAPFEAARRPQPIVQAAPND